MLQALTTVNPNQLLDEVRAERAERSLYEFFKQAWHVLEPDTKWLDNWHIQLLAEYLEAVSAGQITRLVINLPPRYFKSTAVTVCWPAWEWIKRPALRFIFASYAETLAHDLSVTRRMLLASDWYQDRWGDRWAFTGDQNVAREQRNDHQGKLLAVGMGTMVVGKGADRIVIDDPHDPVRVESATVRQAARDFYQRTLYQRLNNKQTGPIVAVMQRTHQEDLTGLLLEQGFLQVKLPMVADSPEHHVFPVSGRVVDRAPGDVLWPDRDPAGGMDAIKLAVGPYAWAGQNQQEPSPAGGGLFPRAWWRFWHWPDAPLPAVPLVDAEGVVQACACTPIPAHKDPATGAWVLDMDEFAQSWDTGLNVDIASRDYVAGLVGARLGPYRYLLDAYHQRVDLPGTLQAIRDMSAQWPRARRKWVEAKANGPAVLRRLAGELSGLLPVQPDGNKEQRAQAAVPDVASHHVLLPHPSLAPWVLDFIEECANFPNGKHDDYVDVLTQMINKWANLRGKGAA